LSLYRPLARIADPALDEKYRDSLCVAVLLYLHSRMSSVLAVKPPHLMTDEELEATRWAEHSNICARSGLDAVLSDADAQEALRVIG
jgi:hypothetical protein